MKKTQVKMNGAVVIPGLEIADSFITRFNGLMFRKSIPDDYGLLISPCNQIHMFNMRFPLDIIYLSEDNTVLHIDENIQPWKVGRTVKKAVCVIEVNAFFCRNKEIGIGDTLVIGSD